jgi:hypothetical protein
MSTFLLNEPIEVRTIGAMVEIAPSIFAANLLMAHFVGDWWLQPREMAMKKSSDALTLLRHIVRVTGVLALPVLLVCPERWYLLGVNAAIHAIIDWNIWRGYKADVLEQVNFNSEKFAAFEYWKDKRFYDIIATDQFLHLLTIFYLFM